MTKKKRLMDDADLDQFVRDCILIWYNRTDAQPITEEQSKKIYRTIGDMVNAHELVAEVFEATQDIIPLIVYDEVRVLRKEIDQYDSLLYVLHGNFDYRDAHLRHGDSLLAVLAQHVDLATPYETWRQQQNFSKVDNVTEQPQQAQAFEVEPGEEHHHVVQQSVRDEIPVNASARVEDMRLDGHALQIPGTGVTVATQLDQHQIIVSGTAPNNFVIHLPGDLGDKLQDGLLIVDTIDRFSPEIRRFDFFSRAERIAAGHEKGIATNLYPSGQGASATITFQQPANYLLVPLDGDGALTCERGRFKGYIGTYNLRRFERNFNISNFLLANFNFIVSKLSDQPLLFGPVQKVNVNGQGYAIIQASKGTQTVTMPPHDEQDLESPVIAYKNVFFKDKGLPYKIGMEVITAGGLASLALIFGDKAPEIGKMIGGFAAGYYATSATVGKRTFKNTLVSIVTGVACAATTQINYEPVQEVVQNIVEPVYAGLDGLFLGRILYGTIFNPIRIKNWGERIFRMLYLSKTNNALTQPVAYTKEKVGHVIEGRIGRARE